MLAFSFTCKKLSVKKSTEIAKVVKDSVLNDSILLDTILITKVYKEKVHASYYGDYLNGRRTANGDVFDNNKYTAAHKKLPFGTKLKITNTVNNEWVIVTVNDRGPFVKGRELDLSKKSFMQIAKYKKRGYLIVNIEIVEE
jgi:rare lipoprotein A